MTRTSILLLILGLIGGLSTRAQNSISISSIVNLDSAMVIDTVADGFPHTLEGILLNLDTASFQGDIEIVAAFESPSLLLPFDTLVIPSAVIPGLTNHQYAFSIEINPNEGFQYGLNWIKLWPRGNNVNTIDTVTAGIVMVHNPFIFLEFTSPADFTNNAIPDTVQRDQDDFIPVNMVNDGVFEFADNLKLFMGVQNNNFQLLDSMEYQVALDPGAPMQTGFEVQYSIANNFDDGGNIIVIWPRAETVDPTNPVDTI